MRKTTVTVGARVRALALVAPSLAGCFDPYDVCDPVDATRLARLPSRLSETGLYADVRHETLAAGVRAYEPRFALWSDGASKRRWFWVPPGARIDTTNMNDWTFPEGTRFWKEFSRDGVRVETRFMQKVGPGAADWAFIAYVWRSDGADAIATPAGLPNALGTPHDVPAANLCVACHGGRASRVLGFSAVQLSRPEGSSATTLRGLSEAGLLTTPAARDFEVPGDATARASLGYLHANCGHCHNQTRPPATGARCYDPRNPFDFSLRVERLASVFETPAYESAVGRVIRRGAPDQSRLIELISRRGEDLHMPPLATERVDVDAVALLRRWISSL